jgi:hypothetical protein
MGMDDITKWITGEWAVIAHAPVTFLASILVAAFLIWKIIQWQYGVQLTNTKSTLTLRDAQLQDYKDKLSGATPDEAKARMDALETRLDEIVPRIAALGPRRISSAQRQAMVPFLDRFRGSTVDICSDAASADAAQMSKDLSAAFNAAAWQVRTSMVMGLGMPPVSGIGIMTTNPNDLTDQQKAIIDAFQAAGLNFDMQLGPPPHQELGQQFAGILLTNRLHD